MLAVFFQYSWTKYACNYRKLIIEKDCKHIYSVSDSRLQAHLVLIISFIASILSPYSENYYRHMWFIPIWSGWSFQRNFSMNRFELRTDSIWFSIPKFRVRNFSLLNWSVVFLTIFRRLALHYTNTCVILSSNDYLLDGTWAIKNLVIP